MRDYKEFIETKKRYEASTPDVVYPMTYHDWMKLPHEYKASALFVTFFEQIKFVVKEMETSAISDADMVSAIMFRLIHSVNFIDGNPKKYTTSYVRKIAKNALLDFNRIQSDKDHRENNVSNIQVTSEGREYDLFDSLEAEDEYDPMLQAALVEAKAIYTKLMESGNTEMISIIRYLIGEKKAISQNLRRNMPKIMSELRKMFAEPASKYRHIILDCKTFEDVLNNEELINSCTVMLNDGTEAVWFGETEEYKNGAVKYIFYSKKYIHSVPKTRVMKLKVISVEAIDEM